MTNWFKITEQCDITLNMMRTCTLNPNLSASKQWRECILLMTHPWPQLELKQWSTSSPWVGTRGSTIQSSLGTLRLNWNTIMPSRPPTMQERCAQLIRGNTITISTKKTTVTTVNRIIKLTKNWQQQYSATTKPPKMNYRQLSTYEFSSQATERQ